MDSIQRILFYSSQFYLLSCFNGTTFDTKIAEPELALLWENLSCDGKGLFCTRLIRKICFASCAAKQRKQILSNVSGCINFGELTAFMGPSGAGKSTILKCLTQGKNYPGVQGRIAVDTESEVRACLISQNDKDHLLLNLTVTEALMYASQMKNPFKTTESQHTEIVDGLLSELDLKKANNTMIDKCSGGQKKRIAIGLELTAKIKPNFLFLDEPTSGLDSYSGLSVVRRLRQLAIRRGIAVVTVIHQPSFEIFSQFHNVYILSKVGRCVFTGSPEELREDLIDYNYISTNSQYTNPADLIIKIASSVSKDDKPITNAEDVEVTDELITTARIKSLQNRKADCENMTKKMAENWKMTPMAGSGRQIEDNGLCSYSASFRLYTLWVLLERAFVTSIWRQKQLIFIRLILHMVVVVILAALYNRNLGTDPGCIPDTPLNYCNCSSIDSETVPQQNVTFQFFSLLFLMFAALMPTVLTFPAEIKLFINEHRNGWYSTSSYYISKTLVEIPCQMLFPFCYVYFLYWFSQQPGMDYWYGGFFMSWRYANFLGVTILCCFIAQGLGFLIGILCVNSFEMAIILSSSVLLFLFLFSGFFVKIATMNTFSKGITYLSFIRFSFESLLVTIYGYNRCEFLPNFIPAKSAVLTTYTLNDKDLTMNWYWLLGHLVVIRIIAFLLLRNLADDNFIKMPTNCSFLFDKILPKCRNKKISSFVVIFISVGFALSTMIGLYVIVIKENNLNLIN